MKKYIFSGIFLLTTVLSHAQADYYFYSLYDGYYTGQVSQANLYTTDFSSDTIDLSPMNSNEIVLDLHVENQSGTTQDWIVSRRRIGVDTSWTDFLCWGHQDDPFGTCIGAFQMDTNIYIGSVSIEANLLDGEYGKLSIHIKPNESAPGCGTYRYYVGTLASPFMDSSDVIVCFSLGIDEMDNSETNVSISPNPANDFVIVSSEIDQLMRFELYNSLGQKVNSGSFTKSNKLDVSKLECGIYFITVYDEGNLSKTEKIIISH